MKNISCIFSDSFIVKLDVDPQRDDDASPMSTYRCMLRPTWMISALQHKSKYKSNSISNFFEKKNQIFGFPWCSTREDLSIDVSITNVGLILTKLGWFLSSFLGVQTDRQTRFWNPHMETCRHTKNFNSKLKIRSWLSIPICLPGGRGCIITQEMNFEFKYHVI